MITSRKVLSGLVVSKVDILSRNFEISEISKISKISYDGANEIEK